jgi:hypothetical protein
MLNVKTEYEELCRLGDERGQAAAASAPTSAKRVENLGNSWLKCSANTLREIGLGALSMSLLRYIDADGRERGLDN